MKKIKYFLVSILVMCTVLGLCACGTDGSDDGKENTEATTTKKEEVTTEDKNDTDETTPAQEDGKVHYTVKVVDESGNPVAGALVQLCSESCYPGKTNDEGIAEFSLEEAEYKASFLTLPEGYAYSGEDTAFYFENGSDELTITLKKES